ncbi:MAG: hypothetical protein C5B55_04795 [Blastocatellia bacterium]|nr:MAG: hypothetical protein C5B55_04795 [Blastocatellia bacterium]
MTVCLLLLVLFFPSLSGSANRQAQKAEVESDIREAVLRYLFEHEAQQQKPYTKVLFISIEKKDPDDKFIARFKDHTPPVKKGSESELSSDIGGVRDKKTGEGGILYRVGGIKWINEHEVEVDGSYYVANLFAGGCSYRVVQDGSKWIVKGCGGKMWMS